MGRSADYTIKGFLYQFNLTLSQFIQASEDAEITIEGIVEDIEVNTLNYQEAIQCKYHESHEKYNISILYKPLLQMMKNFKLNQNKNINYRLFVYFPNESEIFIDEEDLGNILKSRNRELKNLINETKGVNISEFIKFFKINVTPEYDELVRKNISYFENSGYDKSEVETLFYPNSIQMIADFSIKHDEKQRKITRKEFFKKLFLIRDTAISKWTLSLKNYDKILKARAKQLKPNLNINTRSRLFIIFSKSLEHFDEKIVLFIEEFLRKYHFKEVHKKTPIFVLDISEPELIDIANRLFNRGQIPNLGRPVKDFNESSFYRPPMAIKDKKEFTVCLISWDLYQKILDPKKVDDIFIIGHGDITSLDISDINLEKLEAKNFNEIKFMMGIIDDYTKFA